MSRGIDDIYAKAYNGENKKAPDTESFPRAPVPGAIPPTLDTRGVETMTVSTNGTPAQGKTTLLAAASWDDVMAGTLPPPDVAAW